MSFEIFTEKHTRFSEPVFSICKSYYIRFNKPLIKKYGLDKFKYAVFYFDVEIKKIGIIFSIDRKPHSYYLNVEKRSISILCKSFLKHYNILRPQKIIRNIGFEKNMLIMEVEIDN